MFSKRIVLVISVFLLTLSISSQKTGAIRSLPAQTPPGTKVYAIGSIPPQVVRQGVTLQFQVQTPNPAMAAYSLALDPSYPVIPQGPLSLNANSGLFSYQPAAADKFEFSVRFTSTVNGAPTATQTVVLTPLANLPPESDLLSALRPTPDPESIDYQVVSQTLSSAKELFNGVEQPTRTIQISGKHVIFADNDPKNTLYPRFNNAPDIKSLTIYAEKLIVRSPLKLPGTTVTIYARELRFEDAAGQASLDTTPKAYLTEAAQFANGLPGQKAGDIALNIQSFYSDPNVALRLIANGGKGQNAGQGRAGSPKSDLIASPGPINMGPGPWTMRWGAGVGRVVLDWSFKKQSWGWVLSQNGQNWPQNPTPYPSVVYVRCDPCGQYSGGKQEWPADGEDAIPPGVPGTGGGGGTVSSSLQVVAPYVQTSGGLSGQPGSAQRGGLPQNPVYSAWLKTIDGNRCNDDYFNFQVLETHTSVAGKDAPSKPAAQPQGANGSFAISSPISPSAWLHPNLLRMVLAHAKDAYIGGNLDYAKLVFTDYLDLVNNYGDIPDPTAALQFAQAKAEMEGYLQNINSNLDYFGHPANWVPLLSLEATMKAFSNEVDAAILILYLRYWLENKAALNQKDIQALQDSMSKLDQDITQIAADADTAMESLPSLQFQSADISVKLQMIQEALERKEAELEKRAQDNVEERHKVATWKRALRVIATVAKLVPVYQPALGIVGSGLELITNIDTSKPLNSIGQITDLAKAFDDSKYQAAADGVKTFLKSDLTKRTNETAFDYAKRLFDAAKDLGPAAKLISQQFKATQIDNAEVQQEFEKIKAEDPQFNELIKQVEEVNAQKQAFARALADTMQKISTLTNQISQNLLTVGVMYRQLDPAIAGFDYSTLLYVREMGRNAQERLLRYEYYMAKAYEYRMLKPNPGDLKLNQVTDRLVAMLGNNYTLNPSDFAAIKAVYVAAVRGIVAQGLDELVQRAPERSLPFNFELTADELRQLNQSGAVTLDLTPRIAGLPNEENRHIADLGVADNGLQVQTSGPVSGFGRVRVVAEHNGQSLESAGSRSYRFTFGAGIDDHPFSWGGVLDVPSGRLDREQLSVAGLSLLQSLLGSSAPINNDALALFVRPGADAVVTLRRYQDPANLNAVITRLRLFVTVDFYRTSSNQVWLNVQAPDTTTPYIVVDQTDLAGRMDGRGSFRRAYRQGTAVKLTAEPVYAGLRFKQWTDQAGAVLSNTNSLNVTLDASRSVRAIYQAPLTVNGRTLALQQGSPGTTQTIATVDAASSNVTVALTSVPAGITIGPLTNNNGTITATIAADCTAAASNSVSLKVTDAGGQTATGTLTVNVAANTPPALGAYAATNVSGGNNVSVTPNAAPADNGSIASLTASVAPASFTGTLVADAATGTVTINSAGPAGSYTVTVKATDNCGAMSTASFALTVNQPSNARIIRVVAASGAPGGTVSVPIEIVSQGDENAIGFSLNFDPAILSNPQASLGSGAAGASLNPNFGAAAQGRLGLAIALPAGQTLSAGTRQIAIVTFNVAAATSAASTPITFGDQPIAREVADNSANTLATSYENGVVTISSGYEADVAPRPNGNGAITISDWTQVGRYVSGMDTPAPGGEFQRADCAPRSSLGNGALTISDWVQAGRYAAGLDPLTPTGGPTAPVTSLATSVGGEGRPESTALVNGTSSAAVVHADLASAQDTITISLDSVGGVNAVGLSLIFNPSQWRYISAALGSDAAGATLNPNIKHLAEGRLGLALALPAGRTFESGAQRLVALTFAPRQNAATQLSTLMVDFADLPIAREVVAADASALASSYAVESERERITHLTNVSAASYQGPELARGQIIAAFGRNLAAGTAVANSLPLPTELAGTHVIVTDSQGIARDAPLFFVSPPQINYQLPEETADGPATITTVRDGIVVSVGLAQTGASAPAIFTADASGRGLPAAVALRISADGSQKYEPVMRFDSVLGSFVAVPIDLGLESDQVFLLLYGTGWRNRSSLSAVSTMMGGQTVETLYAGPQGDFVGLDQINARLPRNLIGRGEVDVAVTVDGVTANIVRVSIK